MTAVTTGRTTPTRLDPMYSNRGSFPMAATTTLYAGTICALNASGYLVAGSTSSTLKVAGIVGDQPFEIPSDRITNSGSAGAKSAQVQMGVTALLENDSLDPITQDDVLNDAYITDNATVCATSGGSTKSKAGRIIEVTDQGVWVAIGVPGVNVTGSAGTQGAQGATGAQGPQGPQGATGA